MKTCETCQHGKEYKCSHEAMNGRPTYANGKEGKVPAPACDNHVVVERVEPEPEAEEITQPRLEHETITMMSGKAPEFYNPGIVRFNKDLSDALNSGWQLVNFSALLDGDQVLMVQTMVRQVS